MPKKATPDPKSSPNAASAPPDELALCLAEVERMRNTGEYDKALVSHLSWLKLNAARTENELAKISERHEKRLRTIAWSQAVAWAKRLTDAEYSRYVREIEQARNGRGSVLG